MLMISSATKRHTPSCPNAANQNDKKRNSSILNRLDPTAGEKRSAGALARRTFFRNE
jgi:hypothetical protein